MEKAIEDPPHAPTWIKYLVLARYVSDMSIRRKRLAFQCMRRFEGCDANAFMPTLGITTGEFCVFHAIAQNQSRPSRATAGCAEMSPSVE